TPRSSPTGASSSAGTSESRRSRKRFTVTATSWSPRGPHEGNDMTSESALVRHDRMVLEEMEQAERVRATADRPADFWQALAGRSPPSADVRPDPAVGALPALISPDARVIDVGAGGGRHATPLARRCREVVAVEPSPAMRAVLTDELSRQNVTNVRIVAATWQDVAVEPAPLVFAAHVTYGVRPI